MRVAIRSRRLLAVVVVVLLALGVGLYALLRPGSGGPHGTLRLDTGAPTGVYYQFGNELAAHMRKRDSDLAVSVRATSGSVQNLEDIAKGQADCAITASDAAANALAAHVDFAAVARVYDDYVQVVTRKGGPIRSVQDLRGRTVSLGASGSGVALVAQRILGAAGMRSADLHAVTYSIGQSTQALREGTIDAFFWSGGLPTDAVSTLAKAMPIELVSLPEALGQALAGQFDDVYRVGTVPVGTYGLTSPAVTVAIPDMIVCSSKVPDSVVEFLTATLFAAQADIARTVPPVNVMDQRTAIATEPVPLHPGALAWYRSSKE